MYEWSLRFYLCRIDYNIIIEILTTTEKWEVAAAALNQKAMRMPEDLNSSKRKRIQLMEKIQRQKNNQKTEVTQDLHKLMLRNLADKLRVMPVINLQNLRQKHLPHLLKVPHQSFRRLLLILKRLRLENL